MSIFRLLFNELRNNILALLEESSQFNTNDVLVNIRDDHKKLLFIDELTPISLDEFPKAILRETKNTQKESGTNPLCLARGEVTISVRSKKVKTPILLSPLTYKLEKVTKFYIFSEEEDNSFLNPFLVNHLKSEFNIDLAELTEISTSLEAVIPFLESKGLNAVHSRSVIGNFHHHRYQVIKELEELSEAEVFSSSLNSLFGLSSPEQQKIDFPKTNLFPADVGHEAVFKSAAFKNTVIQGPPGTGKSQVLTNLIAKFVGASKRTVIISEKHAALAVIQKKLSAFGLDKLCYIASADRMSHSFLMDLKSTWDYFENYVPKSIDNIQLSEQYEANLQMTLDMLSQTELIGGVSFHAFFDQAKGQNLDGKYLSFAPLISDFLSQESIVKMVYDSSLNLSLGSVRERVLKNDQFDAFDEKIQTWISMLTSIEKDFELTTWKDLSKAMKKAALCQVYENELYKKYQAVFIPNSKAQKTFIRLRKKYNQHQIKSKSSESEWKESVSLEEAKSLRIHLEEGSFWSKRKARKRWRNLSHLPIDGARSALEKKIKNEEERAAISRISIGFYDLGLESPESEVPLIHQTLGLFTRDQWQEFENIPEESRLKITPHHRDLQKLHSALLHHFHFAENERIKDYLNKLLASLPKLISCKSELLKLDEAALKTLKISPHFSAYKSTVFTSHYVKFREQFPRFSKFHPSDLYEKISDTISAMKSEAKLESSLILQRVHLAFKNYHKLLSTPARKLSEVDRELKMRLRKGKSILVKEFSKSRSHPSLREIYNSEAREWIQLLKPIWLSNPTQLGKCFPLEEGVFDVAIFDEASQIPIQNAMGGIQRSHRVIVAGDEHQMGPSSHFKTTGAEPMDLLHQASYHFKKSSLKHHYRSEHPDLISFSNTHFYSSELKAFPGPNSLNRKVIQHHFVADGSFITRRNKPEAANMKDEIKGFLKSNKSIGIVAFSEEQLACIWEELSGELQTKLIDHLETYGGFFKALENVQGDECDHLLISFGYAKNEAGDFQMRFGPMNTSNGRRRLNVLLTRAITSIDFYCSVTSSDFKLSDNESINLLRQWITFSENYSSLSTPVFPFGLNPKIDGKKLRFSRIQETLPTAREIVTLQRALEDRGWEVEYD